MHDPISNIPEPEFTGDPAELYRFDLHRQQDNIASFEPQGPLPATALTSLNALRHGGRAQTLFIPGEDPQEFYKLLAENFETYKPATTQDAGFVTDATLARWQLWRRQRTCAKTDYELYFDQPQKNTLSVVDIQLISRHDRYLIHAERGLARAMAALRHLSKSHADDEKWRAQHELAQRKFDLELQKFQLHQEQDARIAPKIKADIEAELQRKQQSDRYDVAQRDYEQKMKELTPHKRNIVNYDGEMVIQQHVLVSEKNGQFAANFDPSNEDVFRMITNKDLYLQPPQRVMRNVVFLDGIVPSVYDFTVKNMSPEARAKIDNPETCVAARHTFENWKLLAILESHFFGHPLPPGLDPKDILPQESEEEAA